jgi:hypothetical protein
MAVSASNAEFPIQFFWFMVLIFIIPLLLSATCSFWKCYINFIDDSTVKKCFVAQLLLFDSLNYPFFIKHIICLI